MQELSISPWELVLTQLLILALFFAMRSCEYLKTRYPEESRRTKILRVSNFVFKKADGRVIHHSASLETLISADLVIITFEFQKNDWRNHSVHMFRTDDLLLCPVRASAKIVKRVLNIPDTTSDSKICSFWSNEIKLVYINSAQALPRLRVIVEIMGEHILGFTKEDDVGLHSIRSGGAMAMYLSGVSTIVITRVGRWSSEAFLEYIREQVEHFTFGVSKKMLRLEHFHTINASNSPAERDCDEEMRDIFIATTDRSHGDPILIDHEINF